MDEIGVQESSDPSWSCFPITQTACLQALLKPTLEISGGSQSHMALSNAINAHHCPLGDGTMQIPSIMGCTGLGQDGMIPDASVGVHRD